MKRFTFSKKLTIREREFDMRRSYESLAHLTEDSEGEWVLWSDVEKLRAYLESQIPERRIEKLEKALGLVHEGRCPECENCVRGYKPPLGLFAPEAFASMREMGVDPTTGHKVDCSLGRKT